VPESRARGLATTFPSATLFEVTAASAEHGFDRPEEPWERRWFASGPAPRLFVTAVGLGGPM
jgi:hypothetical protein